MLEDEREATGEAARRSELFGMPRNIGNQQCLVGLRQVASQESGRHSKCTV